MESNLKILFRSRFVTLNKHHAYFLLVDNGTVGKYGAEIALKRKLEKFISTQRLSANFSTPLVWDARRTPQFNRYNLDSRARII